MYSISNKNPPKNEATFSRILQYTFFYKGLKFVEGSFYKIKKRVCREYVTFFPGQITLKQGRMKRLKAATVFIWDI